MIKYKYILFSIFVPLLAVVFLLSLGWGMGTAAAASESATVYRDFQRDNLISLTSNLPFAAAAACEVETTGDNTSDFTSADATALQNAVNSVVAGTTLKVAGTCAGVQTVNSVVQTVYINKSLTIQGGYVAGNWLVAPNPVANPTILNALNSGRVVYIPSGSITVVLDGLTLQNGNGNGSNGGGIIVGNNVFWTLSNSTVLQNQSPASGGGIYNAATQFTMSNTTIRNNTAITLGGGLYSTGIHSVASINTNSIVRNNTALDGAGIALDNGGVLSIANSSIRLNQASDDGGGVAVDSNTAHLTLTSVIIRSNTASDAGGGLYNNGILTFNNSTVDLNTGAVGGGLYNNNGNPTVTNVLFQGNQATNNGGGVYNNTGTVSMTNATVLTNTATNSGGGVWNGGTFDLSSSKVSGNMATNDRGGGVYNTTVMNITSSEITQNTAPLNDGGGIWNDGPLQLTATKVMTNSATAQDGGGLHNRDAATITTSTFSGNSATDGGGIYNTGGTTATLTISSSTFNDNQVTGASTNRGGAIAVNQGSLTLLNSTLSGNSADNQGGGVWNNNATSTLTYVTIANNTGTFGAGVYNANVGGVVNMTKNIIAYNNGSDCASVAAAPNPADNGYNLIEDNTCVTAGTSLSGDPLLNALAMNGGSTETHLPQLLSPALDKIPAGSCGVSVDQRGAARPVNSACDIGSVELQGVNAAPVAVADSYTTPENTPLTVNAPGVLSNDTDINGDNLTAVLNMNVMSGSLSLDPNGSFTYTPDTDFCGTDSFTYHANDAQADSNIVTVTLNVTCANDAPVAVADGYTTPEDTTLTVNAPGVLANDTDANGDALTAVLGDNVMSGTLVLNDDGSFIYTPNADFCGTDSFVYNANDGQANSNMVAVTINVTCVNDAPVAVNDSYSTGQDTNLVVGAPGVLSNDSDADGDTLTASLDSDVMTGTLSLNSDGSFTYMPDTGFTGLVTFTYHVEDGSAPSNVATVSINVDHINQAPVAVADAYSTAHNTTLAVTSVQGVLANDNDPDGDTLTAVLDSGVSSGSLTLNPNGSFTYTPDNGSCGMDSFTYHANDGQANSNTATVTIDVACSASVPVAVDDSYTTTEGILLDVAAPGVLTNDSDADGDTLTAVLDTDVAMGSLALNDDGSFVYTPPVSGSGVTTFTYHVEAGGDSSNTAVVTITVEGANNAPVATNDSYTTDEDVTLNVTVPGVLNNDSDIDGDILTTVLDTDVTSGSLTLNSNGSFDYTPDAGFCGTDNFTYHANDGLADSNIATVTITVTCVNPGGFILYLPYLTR